MVQTFVYPFIKINEEIFRPLIPVKIIHPSSPNTSIITLALIDTGADSCVFPRFIADVFQYNLKTAPSVINQGINESKTVTWKHNFKLQLLSANRKTIAWKSNEFLIGSVDHNLIPPLLGYANFLSFFNIILNYPSKKITIEVPAP